MEKRFVYADNAATTAVSKPVLEAMLPYFCEEYGNPSSIYALGRRSLQAIETARAAVAAAIGANANEIYFTGSGSEADNWAIKGTLQKQVKQGKNHIVTTVFEHHALLHTVEHCGCEYTLVPVDENGLVAPQDVKAAIRPETALVSVMFANNEIGTIQPIAEIAAICKESGVLFHTDAVQAVGNVPVDVQALGVDMLSLSAHKLHGPKGVGALYCRRGTVPKNLIDGGGQEGAHRAGTENVAGIVGLGVAIQSAVAALSQKQERLTPLRDRLIREILKLPRTRLNGDANKRLPGNVNISFEGVEGESLLLSLDNVGIAASSGSACTSGSLEPSHVLLSLGLTHEVAHGSLRLSLSEDATDEDIDYILEQLPPIIERLRVMSPLWEHLMKQDR